MPAKGFLLQIPAWIAAALLTTGAQPTHAEMLWLLCGNDQVKIDTDRKEYKAEVGGHSLSGGISITPEAIIIVSAWTENGEIHYELQIDRNSLRYRRVENIRSRAGDNKNHWDAKEEQTGQCNAMAKGHGRIMQTPAS